MILFYFFKLWNIIRATPEVRMTLEKIFLWNTSLRKQLKSLQVRVSVHHTGSSISNNLRRDYLAIRWLIGLLPGNESLPLNQGWNPRAPWSIYLTPGMREERSSV